MYSNQYQKLEAMNITRNNYEEYFLLYVDNELSAEEREAVEQFLEANPDLKIEMEMLTSTILPEEPMMPVFPDKSRLFRTEDTESIVNLQNHESYFVQYADNELTNEEKAATEKFVYDHPELQADFELIQRVKYSPDPQIVFPHKETLYRQEKVVVRAMFATWTRYAAAAAVILALGLFWMMNSSETVNSGSSNSLANNQPESNAAAIEENKDAEKAVNEAPQLAKAEKQESTSEVEQLHARTEVSPVLSETKSQKAATVANGYEAASQQLAKATPQPVENSTTETTSKANPLLPAVETPVAVDGNMAANTKPVIEVEKPGVNQARNNVIIPVQTSNEPVLVAMNDVDNDNVVFIPGKEVIRKTPLRGLLRKAGRFIDKNNPLSEDRAKPGVFTASNEQ